MNLAEFHEREFANRLWLKVRKRCALPLCCCVLTLVEKQALGYVADLLAHLKRVLNDSDPLLKFHKMASLRHSKSLRTGFCCSIDEISVPGQLPS